MTKGIKLQSLVDTHQEPFLVIDKHFYIVAANQAFELAYGIPQHQLIGQHCYEASHANHRPCAELGEECPYQQVYHTKHIHSCLHTHYDATGQIRRVRVTVYPIESADGELYLGEALEEFGEQQHLDASKASMVGKSKAFMRVLEQLELAAASEVPVLLQGETGTGKELAASYIHNRSSRRERPFLTLDCTVLTEALFESEVFGYERGAFTGSFGEKKGLFELAHRGTLFLDEIGEMSTTLQAKLLRLLETGEFRRVGGREMLHGDARILCATNRALGDPERFRKDLYYRVACLSIALPALRERPEDIPELAQALLQRFSHSTQKAYRLMPGALARLQEYHYPGNIRELRNVLSVAASNSPGGQIDAAQIARVLEPKVTDAGAPVPQVRLPSFPIPASASAQPGCSTLSLHDIEAQHIAQLLREHNGNRRKVAEALGISERTMYRKLSRYGIS